jgi:dTMP kinase
MGSNRGLFITFEGGEGAGKTTLIERMGETLCADGIAVVKTREPGGTHLGERVRNLLLEPSQVAISPYAELCLFLASRAQHVEEVIRPALEQKKVVLCDRFNDSTIAYQGVARGLGMKEVAHFCDFICQGVQPHLTFYLDIEPSIGLKRAMARGNAQDRIESEKIAFHQKIRETYHKLCEQQPARLHLLDARKPAQEVFYQAMSYLERYIQKAHV